MMAAQEIPARIQAKAAWLRTSLKVWGYDLLNFWNKLHRDWVLKFASMLAYQFMVALVPLLLFIVGCYGLLAPLLSKADALDIQQSIAGLLPFGIGPTAIGAAITKLHHSSGFLLLIGLILAIGSGSHLFYSLQDCANIIFRLTGRHYLFKQALAIFCTLLLCGIVPFAFALAPVPLHWLHLHTPQGWFGYIIAFIIGWVAASGLVGAMYKLVTHGTLRWRAVWPGAIVAGLLLLLFEQIFPVYVHDWLKPNNYGYLVGFFLIILAFFYYLSFILLLGMEITSWRAGQRQTAASLPTIIHAVQVDRSIREVAGPTAGKRSEDLYRNAPPDAKNSLGKTTPHREEHAEEAPSSPSFRDRLHDLSAKMRQPFVGDHRGRAILICWILGAVALLLLSLAAHAYPVFPGDIGIAEFIQLLRFTPLPPIINIASDLNWPLQAGAISISAIIALLLVRQIRAALGLAVATYSADLANILINGAVGRPRPNNIHIISPVHVGLHSFPSGHVSHSVAFYGFAFMLLIAAYHAVAPRERIAIRILQGCCIFVIAFVGISRVLEGEHWPSDVLGGYLLGVLCLTLGIAGYHMLPGVWQRVRGAMQRVA